MGRVTRRVDKPNPMATIMDAVKTGVGAYATIKGVQQNDVKLEQDQQQIGLQADKLAQDREHALAQANHWKAQQEQMLIDGQAKQAETTFKTNGFINDKLGQAAAISSLPPEKQKAAYEAYWATNGTQVLQAHSLRGSQATPDQIKNDFLVGSRVVGDSVASYQSMLGNVTKQLNSPDKFQNVDKIGQDLATMKQRINEMTPYLSKESIQPYRDNLKQIEERVGQLNNITSQEKQAQARANAKENSTDIHTARDAIKHYNSTAKPIEEKVSAARSLTTMSDLAITNAIAKGSIGFTAAITAGSNSQLSDAERETFTKAGGVLDKAAQSFENMESGTLIPEMAKQYKAWAKVMEQRHSGDLKRIQSNFKSQYVETGLIPSDQGEKIFTTRDANDPSIKAAPAGNAPAPVDADAFLGAIKKRNN
jgi:hypothetical protein